MPRISQTNKGFRAGQVIAGIRKRLARGRVHRVGGKDYSHEELVAIFQRQVDALDAIRSARVALAVAVSKERAVARQVRPMTRNLQAHVQNQFGSDATAFADFGWELPKKRGPKTVAAKAEGARKAKATREARHTMGKRQRLKIRG
jgi:hypothetical protein